MAVHGCSPLPFSIPTSLDSRLKKFTISSLALHHRYHLRRPPSIVASRQLQALTIDKSALHVADAVSEAELWAASLLRVRSFYDFPPTFGIEASCSPVVYESAFPNSPVISNQLSVAGQSKIPLINDHKRYLAEREFEALKERVAGKRLGFKRVSCINATLPLSQISSISDDLCMACKFTNNGEDRVVVGTLDLNQCVRLPDEITGMKPMGIGADFARAYLSNVCVAKELYRNGLGYSLVAHSKIVAEDWGISDLYVHVAVDNEPAKNLYIKSGFVYENDEPAWQARFLDRPRRIILWSGLSKKYDL